MDVAQKAPGKGMWTTVEVEAQGTFRAAVFSASTIRLRVAIRGWAEQERRLHANMKWNKLIFFREII